jgi:hypothetical protein
LHQIGSGCHVLPHFNSYLNRDADLFSYEYKMDVSDLDFYSDINSIQFKVHIVTFNIHEENFTTKFVDNQSTLLMISNIKVN